MLFLNKSHKNRKVSLTIHYKYKYFDSTVQRAEDRRQKFYFCRLPFAVNVKLNLSILTTGSLEICKFLQKQLVSIFWATVHALRSTVGYFDNRKIQEWLGSLQQDLF